MDSIEPISICLAIGSKAVLDSMCSIPIVFCEIGSHAITQHVTYWIIETLPSDIILGMDWLKYTNLIIDLVACSLELPLDAKLYTVFALPLTVFPM